MGLEAEKHHRIVVMSTQGFSGMVPIANVDRVRSMEGIQAAVPYSWFGGSYEDQQMAFAQFATDPTHVFDVWSEYEIDPDQLKQFKDDRQACVADVRLAERMGLVDRRANSIEGYFLSFDLDLKLVVLLRLHKTPTHFGSIGIISMKASSRSPVRQREMPNDFRQDKGRSIDGHPFESCR